MQILTSFYIWWWCQEELEAVFKEMQKRNLVTRKVITVAPNVIVN